MYYVAPQLMPGLKGICKRELGDVERFATRDWLALAERVEPTFKFPPLFALLFGRPGEKLKSRNTKQSTTQTYNQCSSLSLSLSSIVSALNLLYSLAYIFTQWQSWKEIKRKGKGARYYD
jgi:hypothetical protein